MQLIFLLLVAFLPGFVTAEEPLCRCANSSSVIYANPLENITDSGCIRQAPQNGTGRVTHVIGCVLKGVENVTQAVHEIICSVVDEVFAVIYRIIRNINEVAGVFFVAVQAKAEGNQTRVDELVREIRTISQEQERIIEKARFDVVTTAKAQRKIYRSALFSLDTKTAAKVENNLKSASRAFEILDACAYIVSQLNDYIERQLDVDIGVKLRRGLTLQSVLDK